MFLQKGMFTVLGIILAAATFVVAQDQATTSPGGTLQKDRIERMERHRECARQREARMGRKSLDRRPGSGRLLKELNLSEAQQQQRRAIAERRLETVKAQREELMKLREKRVAGSLSAEDGARARALREEIRSAMQGARAEMESVLTTEQKARLEELQKERKIRIEQRMQERQLRRQDRLNNRPIEF